MELASQIIGIVAIVISVMSMLFKSKTNILLFTIIYNILTLTSYLLLGKYLGSILVGILTLKSIIYYLFALKKAKPNIYVLIVLEIAILTTSIFLWQSWPDIFILISSLINTYTTWQDNVKIIKISAIISAVLLILYDAFIGAYVYIISETLYGGAAIFSIVMMFVKNKKAISNNEANNNEINSEDKPENEVNQNGTDSNSLK